MRRPNNWQSFTLPTSGETAKYLTTWSDSESLSAQELWDSSTGLNGLLTARKAGGFQTKKPKGQKEYEFDQISGRYRDVRTGRTVSENVMRRAVMKESAEAQRRLREETRQLIAGTIMFAVWYGRSRSILKALYKTIFALHLGGFLFDDQTQRELFWALLLMQFKRFDDFVHDLDSKELDGHVLARAGSYGRYGNALYQNIKLDQGFMLGHTEGRRVLGENENHCKDDVKTPGCIELAAKGWMPIAHVLPLGGATCRANCLCTIETRRAP